ncbi:hypothetical protein C8R43DRAFT_1108894 [Mycena crocata]|nr:hypothetical protein C8R43DRAFT_1108891 [Mycena crocata]KAJ7144828.1 hypothetical protein C8R43DRAFT_1108894 [Mycena crocata]
MAPLSLIHPPGVYDNLSTLLASSTTFADNLSNTNNVTKPFHASSTFVPIEPRHMGLICPEPCGAPCQLCRSGHFGSILGVPANGIEFRWHLYSSPHVSGVWSRPRKILFKFLNFPQERLRIHTIYSSTSAIPQIPQGRLGPSGAQRRPVPPPTQIRVFAFCFQPYGSTTGAVRRLANSNLSFRVPASRITCLSLHAHIITSITFKSELDFFVFPRAGLRVKFCLAGTLTLRQCRPQTISIIPSIFQIFLRSSTRRIGCHA